MRKDTQQFYRTLELNPGATPVEIRGAYRQLVQRWHPDRFKSGSLMQSAAEELTKEINEAYDQLYKKQLYKKFFPGGKAARQENAAAGAAPPKPVRPKTTVEKAEPVAPKRPSWNWPAIWRDPWVRAAVACAVVLAGLALWPKRESSSSGNREVFVLSPRNGANETLTRSATMNRSIPTRSGNREVFVRVIPRTGDETLTRSATKISANETLARCATTLSHSDLIFRAAEGDLEVIEVGMEPARVLALQGRPDDASSSVFRYGSSLVYFTGGRVSGWSEGVPELRIRKWPTLESKPRLPFTIGATRMEVLLAQGVPTLITSFGYHYDSSVVFFESDRVVNWIEGNMGLRGILVLDLDQPGRRPGLQ